MAFHLGTRLTQPASLATQLEIPPDTFAPSPTIWRWRLREFGVEPSGQVQRIAMVSKRTLKRINNPDDVMTLPGGSGTPISVQHLRREHLMKTPILGSSYVHAA